tara:strand:- start:242 stop:433 length:192 start_codon:yes stop_codon:yes gene_type:complete
MASKYRELADIARADFALALVFENRDDILKSENFSDFKISKMQSEYRSTNHTGVSKQLLGHPS